MKSRVHLLRVGGERRGHALCMAKRGTCAEHELWNGEPFGDPCAAVALLGVLGAGLQT